MLKKLTLLATVLVMTMGIAQATPKATGGVELTATEMDTVSAGHPFHYVITSEAFADAASLALGTQTAAATASSTLAAPGVSESYSSSAAASSTFVFVF